MISDSPAFHGQLIQWPSTSGGDSIQWNDSTGVSLLNEGVKGWREFSLKSSQPLCGEMATVSMDSFNYRFLVRDSRFKALVSSPHNAIISEALRRSSLAGHVQPHVNIEGLVRDLTSGERALYAMSRLYSRIEGFGNSLRSVSLYGEDLAGARLFHEILGRLLPHRVELRDLRTGSTLLSIASRGEVSFVYRGNGSLVSVDATMKNLARYITWPLPSGE